MAINAQKDKGFYKQILTIALPIALQNLVTFLTSMMDTIMLGRADDTGTLLSASSQANQPFFILSMVCFGLSGAATVLCAQYWGKQDMASIRRIFSLVTKAAFAVSMVLGLAVLLFPEAVMRLYTSSDAIVAAGAEYLRIIGFAYFTFGVSNTFLCALRGIEIVRIAVVVNGASFVTNVFLNWVLIFGNLGAPAMGIRGAAIATLTARLLEFVILCVYVLCIDKRLKFRLRHLLMFDKVLARDLLVYGSPVLANEVMWSLGVTLQAAILGHITYSAGDPVAANAIASMVQQLATIFIFGVANAAAVMVGKCIGEGNVSRARARARRFTLISVMLGVGAGLLVFLCRDLAIGVYDIAADTKALAEQLMVVVSFIVFFVSLSAISMVGTLRGGGDTRFCLVSELAILWGVAVPLAFVAAYVFRWPVPLVLVCMKIDEPIKAGICLLRLRGTKWTRSLARERTFATQ